jgi:hypothetical protein
VRPEQTTEEAALYSPTLRPFPWTYAATSAKPLPGNLTGSGIIWPVDALRAPVIQPSSVET